METEVEIWVSDTPSQHEVSISFKKSFTFQKH